MSDTCTLTNAAVQSTSYPQSNSMFSAWDNNISVFNITVNPYYYYASIQASIGFQEFDEFSVSLLGSQTQTFATDCKQEISQRLKWLNTPCSQPPTYATNYFDNDRFTEFGIQGNQYENEYNGYNTSGLNFTTNICFSAS